MRRIGIPFNIIGSVDSTNRLALEGGQDGKSASGAVFFALEQTAGKGQRGRTWASEPGQNIMMSVLLDPEGLTAAGLFGLSCAAALAATDLFSTYAGDETAIKWPNDIYWRDRKAGGILIENSMRGSEWRRAVIGFGININQTAFDPGLPNPVSLRQITGRTFDPVALARELCGALERRLGALAETGLEPLLGSYEQRLYGLGRRFRFRDGDTTFEAVVRGVDADGRLVTDGGQRRCHRFGSISWLGPV